MKVPRERPKLNASQYSTFVNEKLPNVINIDKAINFLENVNFQKFRRQQKIAEDMKKKQEEEIEKNKSEDFKNSNQEIISVLLDGFCKKLYVRQKDNRLIKSFSD